MTRSLAFWDSAFIAQNCSPYVMNNKDYESLVFSILIKKYMKFSILCILCDYHVVIAVKTIVYVQLGSNNALPY